MCIGGIFLPDTPASLLNRGHPEKARKVGLCSVTQWPCVLLMLLHSLFDWLKARPCEHLQQTCSRQAMSWPPQPVHKAANRSAKQHSRPSLWHQALHMSLFVRFKVNAREQS